MGKESDRISSAIACLNTNNLPATLISIAGSHCEVWQCLRSRLKEEKVEHFDFVIKRHYQACSFQEVRVLARDNLLLKEKLEDIIPDTLYVQTLVNNEVNVIVLAETFIPWFNIANPLNESEVIPLFRKLVRAQNQLSRFVDSAFEWYNNEGKIIDLFGVDNLILTKHQQVKYVDSFGVFFYEDLLKYSDDDSLKEKIDLSLRRLHYLEYVLKEAMHTPFSVSFDLKL